MRKLLLGLTFLVAGCQYPNTTLEAEPRPAVRAADVQVITTTPANAYQMMGKVYAWSPIPVDTGRGYDMAVEKLRERAAAIGANAVQVPPRDQITLPIVRAQWMWPDSRNHEDDFEDQRPTELMGLALYVTR